MDDMNELFYQQPYVKEFDAVVTGRHIDALLGVYWWD